LRAVFGIDLNLTLETQAGVVGGVMGAVNITLRLVAHRSVAARKA